MWLGAAALALALFIKITYELLEYEVSGVDRTILIAFANLRAPWLTGMAVNLTALGSVGHTRDADFDGGFVCASNLEGPDWCAATGGSFRGRRNFDECDKKLHRPAPP